MDLDDAAADLYQISPEEFVERRKQLVAEARKAGDRELAKQIGQLRRPTRTAWLVNTLAHRQPEQVTELLDLGAQLSDAQRRLAGDDLRRLSAQRRTMIDALARQAVEIGNELGYRAPDGTFQEISQTLQAALGDHDVAVLVQKGTLTQAMVYGGFGSDDLAAALAASTPTSSPKTEPGAEPVTPDQDQQPAEDPAVAAERDRLRAAAEDAQAAAEEAEQAAERATAQADELADRVESLRSELRETEAAERDARTEARSARKHYTELRQAAAQASADAAAAQP
jgi:hypothetical protein